MSPDTPLPPGAVAPLTSPSSEGQLPPPTATPQTYELPLPVGWLDPDAAKVLRRLQHCGYTAYLVGGCVRDLMVGRFPKDFDVGTSALPQEVKRAFSNCRLIGRRFRLAHILYGDNIIEVATFRKDPGTPDAVDASTGEEDEEVLLFRRNRRNRHQDPALQGSSHLQSADAEDTEAEARAEAAAAEAEAEELALSSDVDPVDGVGDDEAEIPSPRGGDRAGADRSRGARASAAPDRAAITDLLIRSDNVFGTPQEDSVRRDFTINGMFFDVAQSVVIDWVGGMQDIEARIVRTIGVPETRFREDPVRMLRAVKFAASLRFSIEPRTWNALCLVAPDISRAAPPRVLEEIFRMMRGGAAASCFRLMALSGLLKRILPELDPLVELEMAAELSGSMAVSEVRSGTEGTPANHPGARTAQTLAVGGVLHYLKALDRIDQTNLPIPNHILLSVLSLPVVLRVSRLENEIAASEEIFEKAGFLLEELGARLRVSRRDRERARLVLLGFIKLLWRAGRNSPLVALSKKSYFGEALLLYGIHFLALDRGLEELRRLTRKLNLSPELVRVMEAMEAGEERSAKPAGGEGGSAESRGDGEGTKRGRRRRRRRRGKGRNEEGQATSTSGTPSSPVEGDDDDSEGDDDRADDDQMDDDQADDETL